MGEQNSSTDAIQAGLDAYVRFYENLTEQNVGELHQLLALEVHFRDPFNDSAGAEKMVAAFRDMFLQCAAPRFTILDAALHKEKAYLKWKFSFTPKTRLFNAGRPVSFIGLSEIRFGLDGKVCEHLDYWDAAQEFYERIPLIGGVLRSMRRRLAVGD